MSGRCKGHGRTTHTLKIVMRGADKLPLYSYNPASSPCVGMSQMSQKPSLSLDWSYPIATMAAQGREPR